MHQLDEICDHKDYNFRSNPSGRNRVQKHEKYKQKSFQNSTSIKESKGVKYP